MADWYRVIAHTHNGTRTNCIFSETAESAVDTLLRLPHYRATSMAAFSVTPVALVAKGATVTIDIPRCTRCDRPGGREAIYLMPIDKVEHLCESCMDKACR